MLFKCIRDGIGRWHFQFKGISYISCICHNFLRPFQIKKWPSPGIKYPESVTRCVEQISWPISIIDELLSGHEKKVLENPHCVHNHGNCIYHTKVLRLYYVKQPVASVRGSPLNNRDSSDSGPHVLHKTFHIPAVMVPSTVKLNGDQRALLPLHHMEDTMAKVRRWISMTGKHITCEWTNSKPF